MSKDNPIFHVFLVIILYKYTVIYISLIKFIVFDKKANA